MIETESYIEIKTEAAEMAETFLLIGKKPPRQNQWQNKYQSRVMQLLWRCHLENIPPPIDLVMLIACLFGDAHDWPVAKFAVINFLADEYDPMPLGEAPPRGVESMGSRIINQYGGIQKNARPLDAEKGNYERDYRATVRGWLKDPTFMYLWAQKRTENKGRKREHTSEILNIIKEQIKTPQSE